MKTRDKIRDFPYMRWVKAQRCVMHLRDGCDGVVEAHHAGDRGFGQKAHDHTCVPLCTKHHREWHDCLGIFRGWPKDKRREFAKLHIAGTRALYTSQNNYDDREMPF
jgi:hypothetical protein